jgi:hypothetical protein
VFPLSVMFPLVPSTPSIVHLYPFLLFSPHFQWLSIHILLSLACPVVMFLDFAEAPSSSFSIPPSRSILE